jgi:1-aminocyclopropane-1-carboxylate deaminase/D-cysteine desulfhydrase-like pyridoxal-dependent ACC family enzyme
MTVDNGAIQQALAAFPSVGISVTPTPIYKLSRLSSRLGHTIYIMREDLTGFAIGGNKVRKLDYLIGDAIARKADTLVTLNASNFSRNAAAAGNVFGFEVHVVLTGQESEQNPASQALFKQFGTHLHFVARDDPDELLAEYGRVVTGLGNQGRSIYELHPGGSDKIGSLGYVNAFDQIVHYSRRTGVHFDRIIHSTGSTATQVGLLLGRHISGYETAIIGMAASQKSRIQSERIRLLAVSTAEMLQIQFDDSTIIVEDGFIGPGYAIQSEEGNEAVDMFAQTEGIMLDDVYTGKAAAGLIHYARADRFGKNENVLFIHTGGNAGQYY